MLKLKTTLLLIFCMLAVLVYGCASVESKPQLHYEPNERPISYDEMLFWSTQTAEAMAITERSKTEERADGTVWAQYDHCNILWSGRTDSKILRLELLQPNLACPRGVFIGNPLEKVTSYYHSKGASVKNRARVYYEETKRMEQNAWEYGYSEPDALTYGVILANSDDSFTELSIRFDFDQNTVSRITYQNQSNISRGIAQARISEVSK